MLIETKLLLKRVQQLNALGRRPGQGKAPLTPNVVKFCQYFPRSVWYRMVALQPPNRKDAS
jgi:hypothetical protein